MELDLGSVLVTLGILSSKQFCKGLKNEKYLVNVFLIKKIKNKKNWLVIAL